jgi:hypothetical protein
MLDTKAAGHKLWFLKDPPCVLKLVFHDNHDCCKGNEEAKAGSRWPDNNGSNCAFLLNLQTYLLDYPEQKYVL